MILILRMALLESFILYARINKIVIVMKQSSLFCVLVLFIVIINPSSVTSSTKNDLRYQVQLGDSVTYIVTKNHIFGSNDMWTYYNTTVTEGTQFEVEVTELKIIKRKGEPSIIDSVIGHFYFENSSIERYLSNYIPKPPNHSSRGVLIRTLENKLSWQEYYVDNYTNTNYRRWIEGEILYERHLSNMKIVGYNLRTGWLVYYYSEKFDTTYEVQALQIPDNGKTFDITLISVVSSLSFGIIVAQVLSSRKKS